MPNVLGSVITGGLLYPVFHSRTHSGVGAAQAPIQWTYTPVAVSGTPFFLYDQSIGTWGNASSQKVLVTVDMSVYVNILTGTAARLSVKHWWNSTSSIKTYNSNDTWQHTGSTQSAWLSHSVSFVMWPGEYFYTTTVGVSTYQTSTETRVTITECAMV